MSASIISMRISPPEPADRADRDQVVVLHDVSWAQFEAFLRARGERPRPRFAYLDGELELMTTSARHELIKKMLARLLEAYCEERFVSANGYGETTWKRRKDSAGLEPDECYFIGTIKRFPDLAIEVVQTSGGIDKLEIYRRLHVREVWFWIDDRIWIYVLVDGEYQERARSEVVSGIDLGELVRIILAMDDARQTETVRAYRRSLRA